MSEKIDTEKIQKLFSETGLKDLQIARQTDLTVMTINKIRRGETKIKNITIRTASQLCKVYDHFMKYSH